MWMDENAGGLGLGDRLCLLVTSCLRNQGLTSLQLPLPLTSHQDPLHPKLTQPQPQAGLASCDDCSDGSSECSRIFS